MADFRWDTFKGIRPRVRARLLPPNEAQTAEDLRLGSGALEPWNEYLLNQAASAGNIISIFRIRNNGSPLWLESSSDVDWAPGPVPDDTLERIYYTGEAQPRMTYIGIVDGAGQLPDDYRYLGIPAPTTAPTVTPDVTAEVPDPVVGGTVNSGGFNTNYLKADFNINQNLPVAALTKGWYLALTGGDGGISDDGYEPDGTSRTFGFNFPIGKQLRVTAAPDANTITVEDANQLNYLAAGDDNTAVGQTWFRDGDGGTTRAGFFRFYLPNALDLTVTAHGLQVDDIIRVTAVPEPVGITFTQPTGNITVDPLFWGHESDDTTANGSPAAVNTWPASPTAQGTDAFWQFEQNGYPFIDVWNENTGPAGADFTIDGSFSYELVARATDDGITDYTDIVTDIESRIYVYTFVSELGEEGPPSPPSSIVTIATEGQVEVSAFDTPPAVQRNITNMRIYRANTGSTATDFQFVAEIASPFNPYDDTIIDTNLGEILQTTTWEPPPTALEGLVAGANGILAGFVGKTVWFSEPYFPHAWPPEYKIAVEYDVVGLGVLPNGFAILTKGTPYAAVGDHPRGMSLQQFEFQQACVSKRSITSTLDSVMYASPDGLCEIGGRGFSVVTRNWATKREWQNFNPTTMKGFWHDNKYFGFYDLAGLVFSHSDDSVGWTTTTDVMQAGFVDPEEDTLYGIFGTNSPMVVAVSDNTSVDSARMQSSPDAITWTIRDQATDDVNLYRVIFVSAYSRFIAVGETTNAEKTDNFAIFTSDDGTTWTGREQVDEDWGRWQDIAYSPSLDVAVIVGTSIIGGNNDGRYSTDGGVTWNLLTTDFNNEAYCVAWSSTLARFVAINSAGTVYTSTTGTSFTIDTGAGFNPSFPGSMVWADGTIDKFACLDSSGNVWYSSTGLGGSWTQAATVTAMNGIGVNADSTLLVAVGDAGTCYTSTDAVTWTSRTTGAPGNIFNDVTWSDSLSLWIAVADTGTDEQVITSPDGITWTERTAAASKHWSGVAAGTVTTANEINEFDGDTGSQRAYIWKSSRERAPYPMNLGAGRIVADTYPVTMNIWNDEGDLIVTDLSVTSNEVFRLPGGYLSDEFEVQVAGSGIIEMVQVAETVQELLEG